jgi:hypothetical protein
MADAAEEIDLAHTWQSSTRTPPRAGIREECAMAIVERVRGIRRWLAAARSVRRLRARGDGGRITTLEGPGAAPRPAARRPDEDPALASRLGRWRVHEGPVASAPAAMTTGERAAAMDDLQTLRGRLDGDQAALIDAALAGGAVSVRRLGPQDGHLWEMPGLRVFAIVGVQAFTVQDEARP